MKPERKNCSMRHENGNCQPIGGFCAANNDAICEGLHKAYDMGWMNAARRAVRIMESESKPETYPNPLVNDPFALVWTAFKNLYPGKECEVFYDQHQSDQHEEEYGFTHFPNDGAAPSVFIYAEYGVNIQVETFAHELAHVAVGSEHKPKNQGDFCIYIHFL